MHPRENEELADFSYRFIISMIVNNEIRPGEAILETELAERFNISRITCAGKPLDDLLLKVFSKKEKKRDV